MCATANFNGGRQVKVANILETIGQTPHVHINRLFGPDSEVWIKLERNNPGGSIKDRLALALVTAAERSGELAPGGTIIEPTSGNTGIGLAMVAAVRGYQLIVLMPENMSEERRRLMLAYGAQVIQTPRELGMQGAIDMARHLQGGTPGAWMPQQFENPVNVEVHARQTAVEILADFPQGLDALITGVGTGGHLSGCARTLRRKWPDLKVYAVEPAASAVLSGGQPGPHQLQGIGAGFVPKNLHTQYLNGVIRIDAEAAKEYARRCAREEGILVGLSSGATLAAIAQKLPELGHGARVLGFNYDSGERYLSTEGFLPMSSPDFCI
jgi:cysteine synthase A